MAHTDQANSFNVLMEMLWEGGAAYDLKFPLPGFECEGIAHNATDLLRTLYPKQWAEAVKVEKKEGEDFGHYIFTFPDKSSIIVYENGDGVEYLGGASDEQAA